MRRAASLTKMIRPASVWQFENGSIRDFKGTYEELTGNVGLRAEG